MKRTLWILVVVALVSAGALAYYGLDADAAAPDLVAAPVTRGSVVTAVAATGTLQPVDAVEVGTQVSGTIASVGADFNSAVRKGQVIATLDQALFASQVEQAQASVFRLQADAERAAMQVADARQKYARATQLGDRGLLARADVETAETTAKLGEADVKSAQAQLVQAEASLAQAKVNLSHTVITAPVDGIVLSRNVQVGQTVAAGLQAPTLFVIARNLERLELQASVDESDVGNVTSGQAATFTVDAYPDRTFTGTVSQVRLQPVVTQNVVSYTTIVDVPNEAQLLKPGMTATVNIETARVDDVVRVPVAALRYTPSEEVRAAYGQGAREPSAENAPKKVWPRRGASGARAAVWQLAEGQLVRVPVETGLSDGVMVAVTGSRLQAGIEVITGTVAKATAAAAPASGSPLIPNMPRRQGGGAPNGR